MNTIGEALNDPSTYLGRMAAAQRMMREHIASLTDTEREDYFARMGNGEVTLADFMVAASA